MLSRWLKNTVSDSELERRWKLVRKAMTQKGLDLLVCGGFGLTGGYARWFTDRPASGTVAFPIEGDLYYISHGDAVHHKPIDSFGVKHLVSCSQPGHLVSTHAPVILDVLKTKRPNRIGFVGSGFFPTSTYEAFVQGLRDVEFVDATELIAPIRAVKSEEELNFVRRSAEMHDMAVEVVRNAVKPGRTGDDVILEVKHMVCLAGSESQFLCSGSAPPGTVCKYVGPGSRTMRDGDQFAMLIECSGPGGYYSEMMPTVCIGRVPKELQTVFDDVLEAQKILVNKARPGADPMEMLKASDKFLREKGYPAEARLAGHSQGVDLVERPALSPLGETMKLKAGMVISLHPTAHGDKAWGYPPSQSFLITDNGARRLQDTSQEIIVV